MEQGRGQGVSALRAEVEPGARDDRVCLVLRAFPRAYVIGPEIPTAVVEAVVGKHQEGILAKPVRGSEDPAAGPAPEGVRPFQVGEGEKELDVGQEEKALAAFPFRTGILRIQDSRGTALKNPGRLPGRGVPGSRGHREEGQGQGEQQGLQDACGSRCSVIRFQAAFSPFRSTSRACATWGYRPHPRGAANTRVSGSTAISRLFAPICGAPGLVHPKGVPDVLEARAAEVPAGDAPVSHRCPRRPTTKKATFTTWVPEPLRIS